MTEGTALGPVVAFLGGLLSFLSPCVLPLVPSYLGFVTGFTLDEISARRRLAMIHAALFVVGFSLVFILLGASATALGAALKFYKLYMDLGGDVTSVDYDWIPKRIETIQKELEKKK